MFSDNLESNRLLVDHEQQKFIAHSLGAWKFKIRSPAWSPSSESPLLNSWQVFTGCKWLKISLRTLIRALILFLRTPLSWPKHNPKSYLPIPSSLEIRIQVNFRKTQRIRGAFSGSLVVKNLLAIAGDVDLIPGWGRSLGEGNDNLLQYSCMGNPMREEPGGPQFLGSQSSQTQLSSWTRTKTNKYSDHSMVHSTVFPNMNYHR